MRFDLMYRSVMPAWGHIADGNVAGTHYEQNGVVSGTWTIGGEMYKFSGVGFRDRIVGPKETARIKAHNWIHGTFPDGRAFALTHVMLKDDPSQVISSACVVADGKIFPATVVQAPMWDQLTDVPSPIQITLESELGRSDLTMEPLHSAPWMYVSSPDVALQPALFGHDRTRIGALYLWESAARATWGGRVGHGHIERSMSVST
jgi:hypothetical protein